MRLLAVVTTCVLLGDGQASAQQPEYLTGLESLRGLSEIRVVIPEINDSDDQVSARLVQRRVELKLRQYGVSVPTVSASSTPDPLAPVLKVTVTLARLKTEPRVVYGISLNFDRVLQGVSPGGRPTVMRGTTYQDGTVGIVGAGRMEQVNVAVDELVETFLNDYLAANAKS